MVTIISVGPRPMLARAPQKRNGSRKHSARFPTKRASTPVGNYGNALGATTAIYATSCTISAIQEVQPMNLQHFTRSLSNHSLRLADGVTSRRRLSFAPTATAILRLA